MPGPIKYPRIVEKVTSICNKIEKKSPPQEKNCKSEKKD